MTTALAVNLDLILKLKEKKWSHQALADRFGVSRRTIERLLKTGEPDREVLAFANKLEKLKAEVPNEYCRKELNKTIHYLRTYQSASVSAKCRRIADAVESGARSVAEIAEEAKLHKEECEQLLAEMVNDGRVLERAQGGVHNRGRKQKYHYYLPEEISSL